jgi:hypothetical protein
MIARTPPTIPPAARVGRYGIGSVSYPIEHDPDHARAWAAVESGREDWAEVRDDRTGTALFRAWRISATSWAWQTSIMGAPAFAQYVIRPDVCDVCGDTGRTCRFERACSCWYGINCRTTAP